MDATAWPLYQRIALKALHLQHLRLSRSAIARRLGVTPKTVNRALDWWENRRRRLDSEPNEHSSLSEGLRESVTMKCGGAIAQVSGKGGGYYGCLGAAKGACANKMLVRRTLAEKIVLEAVRQRLSSAEHIQYVLKQVEAEVGKLYANVPETIRLKETEFAAEERRLSNFIDFIGEGVEAAR